MFYSIISIIILFNSLILIQSAIITTTTPITRKSTKPTTTPITTKSTKKNETTTLSYEEEEKKYTKYLTIDGKVECKNNKGAEKNGTQIELWILEEGLSNQIGIFLIY